MNKRSWFWTVLKLAVSIALVGVLLRAVGVEDAISRIASVHPGWLAFGFGVGFVQLWICAGRWQAVLDAIGAALPFKDVFVFWYIGAFFNQTLPSAVGGDVVRGYLAYKDGVGFAPVFNSLILERVVTVLALLVLVAGLSPFTVGMVESANWFIAAAWAALAVGVVGAFVLTILDRLPARVAHWRLVQGMAVLAGDARALLLKPVHASAAMAWSLAGHVNLSVVVYLLARALDVELGLMTALVLFPPVLLAQTVPVSLAGWGVREGAMVAMFALVGMAGDEAFALSVLYGIVIALNSLPGVLFWLATGRRSMREAEAFAAKAEDA